jgi:hypothetical protein
MDITDYINGNNLPMDNASLCGNAAGAKGNESCSTGSGTQEQ